MARSEDATDDIAERQARDAEAKGEEVNGEERTQRIREAQSRRALILNKPASKMV